MCETPSAEAPGYHGDKGARQEGSSRRRGDDVVVQSSSINWLLFSIAIVLFLLVALLLIICYMRHNLIAKFEQSLEANKNAKTVIKFPPPPPIPAKELPYLEKCPHSSAPVKAKSVDGGSHSIGKDSGIYSGEERYVAEPTSRVAVEGNYSGITKPRPQSQCIQWSRLREEEGAKSGEKSNQQYCSMNFVVDVEETSLYELIDDEALSTSGSPLPSSETLK